ncbi:MAG TPA: MoxR family ATPase [Acidimicrobiia bacterium]|nr:MoxR family ATPase [Acidimicrobiia bacterium]HKZ20537.1 MoxR family ATPase [Acidimicrobiia bacterium]
MVPDSVEAVVAAFARTGYVADRGLAVTTFLGLRLGRPLFLEGEAGVGKTEVAKVLADVLETDLIRLQCYEGLDASQALYEWDYARQMLAIRLIEARGEGGEADVSDIMSREYLRPRPLLQAIEASALGKSPVLLIDELDRADEEFEAYLLELLSDFQVTLPEIGTIRAEEPPVVVITSNRTREIHDALKRRCLYHWLDYPSVEREVEILRARMPDVDEALARQLAMAMADLRALDLFKPPGVAETLDWAAALKVLAASRLSPNTIDESLGTVLKYREDIERVRDHGLEALVHE